MGDEAFERDWAALSADVLSGMSDWRAQHPRATLRVIAVELDGHRARRRARRRAWRRERIAQPSQATTWRQAAKDPEGAVPTGPQGGTWLELQGRRTRRLRSVGGQELQVPRAYGVCVQCGQGLFPSGGYSGIKNAGS
jgi:hypothetical protein